MCVHIDIHTYIYVIMKLIYIKQGNYGGGKLGEFTAKTIR